MPFLGVHSPVRAGLGDRLGAAGPRVAWERSSADARARRRRDRALPQPSPSVPAGSPRTGLGATLAIAYANGAVAGYGHIPLAAFLGRALGVGCAYALGISGGGGRSAAALILAGVTTACFLTAVQTFVQQQHASSLQEVYSWILGNLDTSGWHEVALVAPYVAVSALGILLHRRTPDVLSVGDEEARAGA